MITPPRQPSGCAKGLHIAVSQHQQAGVTWSGLGSSLRHAEQSRNENNSRMGEAGRRIRLGNLAKFMIISTASVVVRGVCDDICRVLAGLRAGAWPAGYEGGAPGGHARRGGAGRGGGCGAGGGGGWWGG